YREYHAPASGKIYFFLFPRTPRPAGLAKKETVMRATLSWDPEAGAWRITDECGDHWKCIHQEDGFALCQREDGQRYHGGYFVGEPHTNNGDLHPVTDPTRDYGGWANGAVYRFDPMTGWGDVSTVMED